MGNTLLAEIERRRGIKASSELELTWLDKAQKLAQDHKLEWQEAQTLSRLGDLWEVRQQPNLALESYQKALRLLENDPTGERWTIHAKIARLSEAEGDFVGAVDHAEIALAQAKHVITDLQNPEWESHFFSEVIDTHHVLLRSLLSTAPSTGLNSNLQRAIQVSDEARAFILHRRQRRIPNGKIDRAGYEAARERVIEAQSFIHASGVSEVEVERLEQFKCWLGGCRDTKENDAPRLEESAKLIENIDRMIQGDCGVSVRQDVRRAYLETCAAELHVAARAEMSPSEAGSVNDARLTLAAIQQGLAQEQIILAYSVLPGHSYLLAITSDRAAFHVLPEETALVSAVTSFDRLLINSGSCAKESECLKDVALASMELGATLLGPVQEWLNQKKAVIVVPSGPLGTIPFEALTILPNDSSHESGSLPLHFFGLIHPISYSLSLERWITFSQREASRSGPVDTKMAKLIVADPYYSASANDACPFQRLPNTAREARTIKRYDRGTKLDKHLRRKDATAKQVMRYLPEFPWIHIAAHGVVSSVAPELHAVILAPDPSVEQEGTSQLGASDVQKLKLDAYLVVLSTCNSAVGISSIGAEDGCRRSSVDLREMPVSPGETPESLARSLLLAGAQQVIATRWETNDRYSYKFMKQFYYHLQTSTREIAFFLARQDIAATHPSPTYWAPFSLIR